MEPLISLSTAEVKERIGYDHLREEVEGWGILLKRTLGNLEDPENEARYQRTMEEVLTEIVMSVAVAPIENSKLERNQYFSNNCYQQKIPPEI